MEFYSKNAGLLIVYCQGMACDQSYARDVCFIFGPSLISLVTNIMVISGHSSAWKLVHSLVGMPLNRLTRLQR